MLLTVLLFISECLRCIALLQNSLQVLLHCLEIVNNESEDRKAYFTWAVEEGVICASYLRRVYEEVCVKHNSFYLPFILVIVLLHVSYYVAFELSVAWWLNSW